MGKVQDANIFVMQIVGIKICWNFDFDVASGFDDTPRMEVVNSNIVLFYFLNY